MSALLVVLLGLPVAVLVLLALPLELRFGLQGAVPLRGHVALRAFFGLWQLRIALPPPAHPDSRAGAAGPGGLRQGSSRRRPGGRSGLARLLRDPAHRRQALTVLRQVLGSLHWRECRLAVCLGLDDPADTGRLWALLGPLGAALPAQPRIAIALQPDFTGPRLDVEAQGRVVLVPLRLLWLLGLLAGRWGLASARVRRVADGGR